MTVVKLLNSKLLERITAPANIGPANRNSAITEKRGKVGSSRWREWKESRKLIHLVLALIGFENIVSALIG